MTEITGAIKVIGETKEYGSNGFKKRELVVTTSGEYPQHILIEFIQDKCDILDKYQVGQNVKVGVNINGREWVSPEGVTKYFNSLVGWRIELEQIGTQQQTPATPATPASSDVNDGQEEDDLPF